MGYPKPVFDRAKEELNRRRELAGRRTLESRDKIYARIPQLREIEREMAASGAGIAKMVIANPHDAEENILQLAKQNLDLQERRKELLEQYGFPPDSLEPQHHCKDCKDKGYVGTRRCHCFQQLLEKQAYEQLSSVSSAYNCTFHTFQLSYYPNNPPDDTGRTPRDRMEDTFHFLKQYAASFTPSSQSLLFMGNTGLGKTHLSLSVAGAVIERGFGVIYTPSQKLLDTLEGEKFSRDAQDKESYAENTRAILTCDLLILDDLGTEFMTQFSHSVMYNIINSRLIENRPTIISTNLRVGEIEDKYSQRMVSRLVCGYKVIPFFGKDIRMIRKAQGE